MVDLIQTDSFSLRINFFAQAIKGRIAEMSHNLLFKGVTSKHKTTLMLILTKKNLLQLHGQARKNIMKMFEKDLSQEAK